MLETVNHSPTELLYRSRFFPHTSYQNHNLFHFPHTATLTHSLYSQLPTMLCTRQNAIQLACNSSPHRFTILHLPKCNSACLQFLTAQIHNSALAQMQFSLPAVPHCTDLHFCALPQDAGHPPQCSIGLCFT